MTTVNNIAVLKSNLKTNLNGYYSGVIDWLNDNLSYQQLMGYLNKDDESTNNAIQFAYNSLGMPPYKSGGANDWNNYVGYFYNYLVYIKMFLRYPKIDTSNAQNCSKIKDAIAQLENEKLAADKLKLANGNGWVYTATINFITEVQGNMSMAYAQLSCSENINKKKQDETIAILNSQITTTEEKENKTNPIVTVIIIVIVLVAVFKLIKG